jgi:hypothetical protein
MFLNLSSKHHHYHHQDKSLEVFELFEENVLNKNYMPGEADIILSTIHAAKGTFDIFISNFFYE